MSASEGMCGTVKLIRFCGSLTGSSPVPSVGCERSLTRSRRFLLHGSSALPRSLNF
jgi:hypothetical protein